MTDTLTCRACGGTEHTTDCAQERDGYHAEMRCLACGRCVEADAEDLEEAITEVERIW